MSGAEADALEERIETLIAADRDQPRFAQTRRCDIRRSSRTTTTIGTSMHRRNPGRSRMTDMMLPASQWTAPTSAESSPSPSRPRFLAGSAISGHTASDQRPFGPRGQRLDGRWGRDLGWPRAAGGVARGEGEYAYSREIASLI